MGEDVTHEVTSVCQQAVQRQGRGGGGSEGQNKNPPGPGFSEIQQHEGLHGSAATGQHPPLYGGEGSSCSGSFLQSEST